MRSAIILHGMPSKKEYYNLGNASESNKHWLPWLQQQLIVNDILAQTPELPAPYDPDYSRWRQVFEQFEVGKNTDLIGHSCGAGFLVRWLSESKVKVGKLVLVAPWLDPDHELTSGFFDFKIDPNLETRTDGISIFISGNDDQQMHDSVRLIKAQLPTAIIIELPERGHFTERHMGSKEFPELAALLIPRGPKR